MAVSKSNELHVGFAIGGFLALWHALWSVLVLLGLAQPFINWIFNLHMINPPYTIMPFSFVSAVTLIIITFVIGFVSGWVLTKLWNIVQR